MVRFLVPWALALLSFSIAFAQGDPLDDFEEDDDGGYHFGFKGGLTVATQNWNSFEMEPLLIYHGDLFIESLREEGLFSLWAQLGYHIRGSRLQSQIGSNQAGQVFRTPSESFQFQNIVLGVGGKQIFGYLGVSNAYWLLGLRAEYTVNTNLDDFDRIGNDAFRNFFPFENYDWINRFVFGATVGAGLEIPLGLESEVLVELSVQPDFSLQYNQPQLNNVISANPFTSAPTTIGARQIRNVTIELSAGFRFRRRVIYID
ncbi:MAG: hypothetical protein AAF741_16660 [Bacteroidota bacterium]